MSLNNYEDEDYCLNAIRAFPIIYGKVWKMSEYLFTRTSFFKRLDIVGNLHETS